MMETPICSRGRMKWSSRAPSIWVPQEEEKGQGKGVGTGEGSTEGGEERDAREGEIERTEGARKGSRRWGREHRGRSTREERRTGGRDGADGRIRQERRWPCVFFSLLCGVRELLSPYLFLKKKSESI
jgi:hypothetical protein